MSFKTREKKRRANLAIKRSRADNRDMVAGRHYRTIVCLSGTTGGRAEQRVRISLPVAIKGGGIA